MLYNDSNYSFFLSTLIYIWINNWTVRDAVKLSVNRNDWFLCFRCHNAGIIIDLSLSTVFNVRSVIHKFLCFLD